MPDQDQQREITPYERFKKSPVVYVGGRSIDLSAMKPFTLGQKKRLEKEGVKFSMILEKAEDETKLVFFILHEHAQELRIEELDELPIVTAQHVVRFTAERAGEVDRPFSISSTSSQPSTGGVAAN